MKHSLRLFSLILFAICYLSTCRSSEVAIQFADQTKKEIGYSKVAVLRFEIDDCKWGDEFTDSVSLYVAKHLPVRVIEREQLSRVVGEQSFSKTGIIDEQTAVKIGKVLGVDAIIFGRGTALIKKDQSKQTIGNLLDTVSIKVVHIESGHVLVNARKKPGTDWSVWKTTKFLLGFGLIWSREDILIETNQYDYVAEQLVSQIASQLR